MSPTLTNPATQLTVRQSHGRVANALAAFLRKRLTIPHVYLQPKVTAPFGVDVLAVDQGGSDDVHGIEIKVLPFLPTETMLDKAMLIKLVASLRAIPIHFRYIAVQSNDATLEILRELRNHSELFDPSGIGRIGVLAFDETLLQSSSESELSPIQMIVRPERYLVRGDSLEALDAFLAKERPDIQVRV